MTEARPDPSSAPAEARYRELRADLTRTVRRVCPPWMSDRHDDLVQVAVMRVMSVEEKTEGNRELSASYLYRVATSALIDEIRRLKRKNEVALEEVDASAPPKSPVPSPERNAASAQTARGLRDCLGRLKQERRLAVTLYLQGHSVPESAELLGFSNKKTENLVYRGLADLRRCLTAKGLQP